MKNIKITKLYTAVVCNVIDEKGNVINKRVMPNEEVMVSQETLDNLISLGEAFKLIEESKPAEPKSSKGKPADETK
jgi:hypothetical protein